MVNYNQVHGMRQQVTSLLVQSYGAIFGNEHYVL